MNRHLALCLQAFNIQKLNCMVREAPLGLCGVSGNDDGFGPQKGHLRFSDLAAPSISQTEGTSSGYICHTHLTPIPFLPSSAPILVPGLLAWAQKAAYSSNSPHNGNLLLFTQSLVLLTPSLWRGRGGANTDSWGPNQLCVVNTSKAGSWLGYRQAPAPGVMTYI